MKQSPFIVAIRKQYFLQTDLHFYGASAWAVNDMNGNQTNCTSDKPTDYKYNNGDRNSLQCHFELTWEL